MEKIKTKSVSASGCGEGLFVSRGIKTTIRQIVEIGRLQGHLLFFRIKRYLPVLVMELLRQYAFDCSPFQGESPAFHFRRPVPHVG